LFVFKVVLENRKQKLSGDLTDVLPEDMSLLVEEAIKISMGTEVRLKPLNSLRLTKKMLKVFAL
jgi:hypothetical protein